MSIRPIEPLYRTDDAATAGSIATAWPAGRAATLHTAAPPRPQILCVMRIPPDPDGHGGSQRAWHLLQALRPHGDVHFALIYREQDRDCMETSLAPLEPQVASVTRVRIAGWQPMNRRRLGFIPGGVWDLMTMRSQDAPHLAPAELRQIAESLPIRSADVIFAGRLCSAVVVQQLLDARLLSARLRLVDFDDIMSTFALRRLRSAGSNLGRYKRTLTRIDAALIGRAEQRIADGWHGVSVCTDADVSALSEGRPDRGVVKVPNAVARERLPPRAPDGRFRLLFTGNLGFAPNIDGLRVFVEGAWPRLKQQVPEAELTVVGLNPGPALIELTERHGFALHANAPSLRPHYAECDVVIAPILFGSGTRIKILEAMAYGRPVVSTTVGAEGLGLVGGRDLLLADRMDAFADALVSLARDALRSQAIADRAHALQRADYTPQAVVDAVSAMLETGRATRQRRTG